MLKKSLVTAVSIAVLAAGGIVTGAALTYGAAPMESPTFSKTTKPRPTPTPHGKKFRAGDPTSSVTPDGLDGVQEPSATPAATATTPGATATAATTAGATSIATPTTSILSLPRIPWEGGPAYYAQFAKANTSGWDDPNFFPISTFLGSANANEVAGYKDAGVNTYLAVLHHPEVEPITNITSQGLFAIPHLEPENWADSWTSSQVDDDPGVVGWFTTDECDMGYTGCTTHNLTSAQCDTAFNTNNTEQTKLYLDRADCKAVAAENAAACSPLDSSQYQNLDECLEITYQRHLVKYVRDKADGRMAAANFAGGTGRTFWSPNQMDSHYQLMDFTAEDRYCYTSKGAIEGLQGFPGENIASLDWPNGVTANRSVCYGFMAEQFQRFTDPAKRSPIGVMVETGQPYLSDSDCIMSPCNIKPDQIEGAVWSALIHEARHISYFALNNGPTCGSINNCPVVHDKVKAINGKVRSLAPVLNTQSYYNETDTNNGTTFHRYTFKNGTDAMLKTYNGSAYIFAGLGFDITGQDRSQCESIDGKDACKNVGVPHSTGSKTFTLPAGVNGTTIEVVGESRTLPVNGLRQFTDSFANEYTHHVYKVSLI